MRRLTFPWLLGARLALARAGILRTALAAIGVAIASFVLLCAIVAPHVAHARSQRDQARTAICAADASRPEHACGMAGVHVTDNWRSDAIRKQLVADGARMPAPPGVSRLPNPGEIVASPALARLLNDPKDSTLRDRYPGRIIGTIGPAGLLEPHELLAYVGSDSAPQPGAQTRIIGYDPAKHHVTVGEGAQPGQSADALSQRQKIITIIATVLALLAPVILFLTSCARLSASSRDRRLAALRIVGLTPPQLQVITAVETGVGAMAGAILGVISLQLARPALAQISPSGYGWFASDLQPSIAQVLAVVLGVPAVALVVGAASTTQLTRKLFSASYTPTRRLSPLRLLPALAGIGLTAWAASRTLPADDSQNTAMTIIMTAGIVFLLVGLALVTPLVAQLVARGVANSSRSLAALLGARRLQFDPATSARVISGLVLLVFCAGFAQTVLATVKSHTHGAAAKSFASGVVEVSAPNARSSDAVAEKILAIPGVRRWIPVAHQSVTVTDAATPTPPLAAIFMSCADLDALLLAPPPSCHDNHVYAISDRAESLVSRQVAPPAGEPADRQNRALAIERLDLPQGASAFSGPALGTDLVVTSSSQASASSRDAAFLAVTNGTQDTLERVRTAMATVDPTSTALPISDVDADTSYHTELYQALLLGGGVLVFAVTLAALIVASIDRAVERRRNVAMQILMGVPAGAMRGAQLVQVLLPYAVGTVIAVGCAMLGAQAFARVGGYGSASLGPPLVTTAVALAAGALLCAASTLPAVVTRIGPSLLRRE